MDASLVPAGRVESDLGASAASGTDQGNGGDPPAVLSGRAAHDLSSWRRLPPTGAYVAVTPPRGRKPVGAKWVFS